MTAAPALADLMSASSQQAAHPSDGPLLGSTAGPDGAASSAVGTDSVGPAAGDGSLAGSGTSGQGTPSSFTDALDAAASQQSTPPGTTNPASTATTSASSDCDNGIRGHR